MTSTNGNIFHVTDGWVNNGEAGDLGRHRAHYALCCQGRIQDLKLGVAQMVWKIWKTGWVGGRG